MIDNDALLAEANEYSQRCFRAMLNAKAYGDPNAPETRAYVLSERIMDMLLQQLQRPVEIEDFVGDHHVYPAGVGR